MDDTMESYFGRCSADANDRALALVDIILRNILDRSKDPRLRTLKFSNARLADGLFTHDGAVALLKSIGFEERVHSGDDVLFLADVDPECRWKMQDILEAIPSFRDRERAEAAALAAGMDRRRSVAFAIRRERWQRASTGSGAAGAFVGELLTRDKFGEGYDALLDRCGVALRVLSNIMECPSEEKFRALKYSNPTVHNLLLRHEGVLELLIVVSGFDETAEGVRLPPDAPRDAVEQAHAMVLAAIATLKHKKAEAEAAARHAARESIMQQRSRESQNAPTT